MTDFAALRNEMVDRQIAARGVRSLAVLDAMRSVPREEFVPAGVREFAYDDSPLPIAADQTISQPYIVAFMVEALALQGGEKVLEIGAGSGYAAAILSVIASRVYTIERIHELAEYARDALARAGCANVEVIEGDGTRGFPEQAPFDAIVVAAGGPEVPESLKQQLKIGGRLVIPIGASRSVQELVRVTRVAESEFEVEDLADVRFVPLIGAEGWGGRDDKAPARPAKRESREERLQRRVDDACDPFLDIENANIDPLIDRVGDARIVLIGEASHGTSEFYRFRTRVSARLIEEKGFRLVGIEGDWPDAARIDHYVRHLRYPPSEWTAFARFPTWMWRNSEMREFVDWLRIHNSNIAEDERIAFHGLDLYSMYSSIREILRYLDEIDPETAAIARQRYGCLTPWQSDPATYGRAALTGTYRSCEKDVVGMLKELANKHWQYASHDGERFLDAVQNARLIANAERYYRTMYYGSRSSWNLRDNYMFETLQTLIEHYAPHGKAIVWAHNSHVGDASATEMSSRGELNIGHLCRRAYGDGVHIIGFGTDSGTVAAASEWDGPMQVMNVRPAIAGSYERLFHETGQPGFTLALRGADRELRLDLSRPMLQRAIGVIYRPETELASHYFQAVLPQQFDEYVWIDRTSAVDPIKTHELAGMPDTYPFGL
ncbi:MAG: protein-L-isoaspartate(D-aspartate) O-methyltransferase [Gammaproteobacteria bacterium]|nr:protein-L-isoaspartate(D-aspartate) O-methyltransferase [Gammaproteobacteria bacterium]MDH4254082.1 protein-L-isoaspartate(D-aspartate) O-methyltransferase [Gammaproteobacteria bacterium]MDH5310476.1 protein-L-isoaspartate(D-aspartate) O-methyltransferase [Gammaproteobacteria bacterium]